mgnify:FL=1
MKKLLILILGAALSIAGFIFVVHSFYNIHITAVFEELEPFPRNLNVYYKGFKLGRSVRVRPSKDFTNTRVDMILNAKGISLPDNITAKVKRKDKKDYIELEYPDAPSITDIKNHSVIQGKKSFDISGYIDEQAEGGGLDEIKDNLNDTVESAGDTLDALTELIGTANDILKDLRPSLKITGENLAVMSQNLSDVTGELSRSAKPKRLDNTFANIEQTTKNIERATKNLENASLNVSNITKHADSQTISLVDCVIQNTNAVIENVNVVVSNVNDIVKGFKATLSKRFAGMKIMFGKPIG